MTRILLFLHDYIRSNHLNMYVKITHIVYCVADYIMNYPSKYVIRQIMKNSAKYVVSCITNYTCLYVMYYVNINIERHLNDMNMNHYEKYLLMCMSNIVTNYVMYNCNTSMRKQMNKGVTSCIKYILQ